MLGSKGLLRRLGVALNLRDPPNVAPHGWSYFDHLVAVYVNLNSADPRADAVIKKSTERADDLTWGDIFLLENVIFSLQPPDVVERSAWILRERFREIASPAVYAKYLASGVPEAVATPGNLSLLKADLTRVLDVIHWYYSLIPMRERRRKSLTVAGLLIVLVDSFLLAGILILCALYDKNFLAVLSCVLYCGMVGGIVSSQRRLQRIPNDSDPLISVFGLDSAGYYLWLSPLLGAIFSVTLMAMFVGGLLKGALFPDFHLSSTNRFFDFTWTTVPRGSAEYAKLFVWAFLAGFAERLVPDSLDRLASKLDPDEKPAVPATPVERVVRPVTFGTEEKPHITEETMQNVMHTGEIPADAGADKQD
jgi:hypothetical protein